MTQTAVEWDEGGHSKTSMLHHRARGFYCLGESLMRLIAHQPTPYGELS
jgi:hypothetical protein